ncbi:MAG: DUF3365 domain-containing protein [Chlorobi bacterium]|nr:DUF3365 domain-containing protein [Chlorobiota bacterium]
MKKITITALSIFFLFFTFHFDENVETARKIVKDFSKILKSELTTGMRNGGAVNAISVCSVKAPEIAKQLSDSTDWQVGRTSLKIRNIKNKPDEWEKTVLEKFENELKEGTDVKTLEYSETVEENGVKYFRYMKAIPTGGVCLNCHGSKIKEPVKKKIEELYPEDKAVGFKKGDIRGAFTLKKKLD